MIVMVKSAPDTADGQRAVALARNMDADLVLVQNGVYFAQKDRLADFNNRAVYALEDDVRLRGLQDGEMAGFVKRIIYDALVDLMMENNQVVGMF